MNALIKDTLLSSQLNYERLLANRTTKFGVKGIRMIRYYGSIEN